MVNIQLEEVKKHYIWGEEEIQVLKGISLKIEQNDFVAIVGESGSGKTTLLNLMGGLDTPDSGNIIVDGKDFTKYNEKEMADFRNKKMGFIFQVYNLLQDFTVLENVMLPQYILSNNKKESMQKARVILEKMGMEHRLTYYPSRLSGGEQQRVAIARSLINNPEIIFADEPTGNLDKENREKVIQLLLDLKKEYGFTLVMVTHDLGLSKLAPRCIRLNYGVIEQK